MPVNTATTTARGTAVTLVGQWTRFVVMTVSIVWLARLLSPGDYGLLAMVLSIIGIAGILGDFGLSLAAIQAKHLTAGQRNNLFWLNTAIGVVAAVVVFALAQPIASFYGHESLVAIVRALAGTFVLNGMTTQFKAELTRRLRFSALAIIDVSAQVFGLAFAVVCAYAGLGYWSLVIQQVVVAASTMVVAGLFLRWLPGLPRRGEDMKSLVSFGANTMGVQALTYISSNIDNTLVGKVWGSITLGVYSRAYNLFELPVQQLAAPLTRVVLPILSRAKDDKTFLRYISRAQLVLSYGLIGSFMVAASFAQPLILILLGPAWHASALIFQLLAIGGVFQSLGYVYYWIFLARKKTSVQLRYSLIGRTIMMGLILIGVQFSAAGAAAGAAAGLAILWLLYSFRGVPRAGLNVGKINQEAIRVVALFVVIFAVNQLVYHFALPGFTAPAALGTLLLLALVMVALAAVIFRSIRNDLRIVWDSVSAVRGPKRPGTTPKHAADGRRPGPDLPRYEPDATVGARARAGGELVAASGDDALSPAGAELVGAAPGVVPGSAADAHDGAPPPLLPPRSGRRPAPPLHRR